MTPRGNVPSSSDCSPDPDYTAKVSAVQVILHRCPWPSADEIALFMDPMGYRQPRVGRAWEVMGHGQPLARRSYRSDISCRVAEALHPFTGQVLYRQAPHIGVSTLVTFYETIVDAYPGARTLYLIMDSGPIPCHPDVLAALEPQRFPWPMHRPRNWPTEASKAARCLNLPIQMVLLPTYAPRAIAHGGLSD